MLAVFRVCIPVVVHGARTQVPPVRAGRSISHVDHHLVTAGRYTPFLRAPLTPAGATVASKVGSLPLLKKISSSSGLDMSVRSGEDG